MIFLLYEAIQEFSCDFYLLAIRAVAIVVALTNIEILVGIAQRLASGVAAVLTAILILVCLASWR